MRVLKELGLKLSSARFVFRATEQEGFEQVFHRPAPFRLGRADAGHLFNPRRLGVRPIAD